MTSKQGLWDELGKIRKHLKEKIEFYKGIYADSRTPFIAKAFFWLAFGYLMLPFDLIPDFIPVIGHVDDIIIVPGLIYIAVKLVPDEVYKEHTAKIKHKFDENL